MPLDDLAGGFFGGILRFLGYIFIELFWELGVRGAGYAVCRIFTRRVDPDSFTVLVVGLVVWVFLGVAGYAIYEHLEASAN